MSAATVWIVVAHGSRGTQVASEHGELCRGLQSLAGSSVRVAPAYLELAEPSVPDAIDAAVASGARRIVLLPYLLHAGSHTLSDLPALLAAARQRHPDVQLLLANHLGPDRRMLDILADRAREAEETG